MEQSKKKVWGEKWSCNYIKTTTTQKKIHDFSFQLPALDFEFQILFYNHPRAYTRLSFLIWSRNQHYYSISVWHKCFNISKAIIDLMWHILKRGIYSCISNHPLSVRMRDSFEKPDRINIAALFSEVGPKSTFNAKVLMILKLILIKRPS